MLVREQSTSIVELSEADGADGTLAATLGEMSKLTPGHQLL